MNPSTHRTAVLWATVIALVLPGAAAAQDAAHGQPAWVADVGVAGANVAVGALTAAVTAAIRGDDVSDAFLKGAAGGGIVFAGKRVAVERFGAAGLLGRQVAGVGTGLVADGGQGRPWFAEVWLPLGPAWFQVRPAARLRARVHLRDVGTIVWAATRPELRFDLERSISNGAPVFVAEGHRIRSGSDPASGVAIGGVVVLGQTSKDVEAVQRHENVHVIQHDYLLHTISRPMERWGWSYLIARDVPLDVGVLAFLGLPPLGSLHEHEADVLDVR